MHDDDIPTMVQMDSMNVVESQNSFDNHTTDVEVKTKLQPLLENLLTEMSSKVLFKDKFSFY